MIDTIYTHYKKKGKYSVLGLCSYQHNDVWYEGIIYKGLESGEVYVRQVENFEESFNLIGE